MAVKDLNRKLTLTMRNCNTILSTLSQRREGRIKDLAMYKRMRDLFSNKLKDIPERPKETWKNDEKPSEEQIKEYNEKMTEFWKKEVEIELKPNYFNLVKSCIENFKGFFTDESACDSNLELAEKFGILIEE